MEQTLEDKCDQRENVVQWDYSVAKGSRGWVQDADGKKVQYCIACKLDTGECLVYRLGPNGRPGVSHEGDRLGREIVYRPVPLVFHRR